MVSRRDDGQVYSVFIAGARDCDKLRTVARDGFEMENGVLQGGLIKFSVFDWREHKSAGFTDGRFQEKVFEDAARRWGKDQCDILVLLLWHRFGSDTQREYEYYMSRREEGLISRLLVCHYNEPVAPLDLVDSKIDQLFDWIREPRKDWAEIHAERGTIDGVLKFQQAMQRQINIFLNENSDDA